MCNNGKHPCDIPDMDGEFRCPFGAEFDSSGYACRNNCGLGVDESTTDEEEFCRCCLEEPAVVDGLCESCYNALTSDEPDVDESMNPYDGTHDWENDRVEIGDDW